MNRIKAMWNETSANTKSLFRGIGFVLSLSVAWLIIAILLLGLKDRISLGIGIFAIICAAGIAGYVPTSIEHRQVPKIFGKRKTDEKDYYNEGPKWLGPGETVEDVSVKEQITDVPPIRALSKDRAEMGLDMWVRWKVKYLNIYLNLENPRETVDERLKSICNDAGGDYITKHTEEECEQGKGEVQGKVKDSMYEQITKQCGIEIIGIDIRPILPVDEILKGLAQDKVREIDVKRHVKSTKEIGEANPELKKDAKALSNTSFIAEGKVKKTIEEQTKKFGVEPETLTVIGNAVTVIGGAAVARFLKKDDSEERPQGEVKNE